MTTVRFGDFEWEDAKATSNVRKHGVSFAEAVTCFPDPTAFTAPDKDHPERFILIGLHRAAHRRSTCATRPTRAAEVYVTRPTPIRDALTSGCLLSAAAAA